MNVAILGFANQGASTLEYWQSQGHSITICDQNNELETPEGVSAQLGEGYLQGLERFDLIVRTPGIHPRDIVAANSESVLEKVTSNTNEFLRVCPSRNIIGVTGTKGKGTTSTLTARMLEAAGYRVHLGGNIGTPPLDMLKNNIEPADYVVLELANFQLIDLKYSPHIAICLMIEPEHMDWHANLNEYMTAKQQLFRWQKPEDIAVYYAPNPRSLQIVSVTKGSKVPFYKEAGAFVRNNAVYIGDNEICKTNEIRLLGQHNWQNVCAATTAVWQITQDIGALRRTISTFSGLPYRLELIRELDSVKYYNDSFGTTPETAIVAIEAFEQPKVVILGGSDKGINFSELAKTVVNNNVKHVVAIGVTAEKILAEIDDLQSVSKVDHTLLTGKPTMDEIVGAARAQAGHGDVVLFSPGCASFGLFKNYKDRAEQFNQAVQSLV